jgi:hypothetical protein
MDAFFLSALVSFGLTLLLMASTATEAGANITLRVGRSLELTAARRLLVLIASAVAIFVIALLFLLVVARIHPQTSAIYRWGDFLSGPIFSSVVLGLLFGILFAFWLRELLRLPNDQAVQRKHVVQAIVLAILLALGAFSDVLRSYVGRVAQISFGGAQVSFAPAANSEGRDRPRAGAQQANSGEPAASAAALQLVSGLSGRINSDARYIANLFPLANAASNILPESPAFFRTSGNIASCISGMREVSADESFGRPYLQELLAVVRQIEISQRRLDPAVATERLARLSEELVGDIDRSFLHLGPQNPARGKIEKSCGAIIVSACSPEQAGKAAASEPVDIAALASGCQNAAASRRDEIAKELNVLLNDDGLLDRPHLSLLEAGLLWSLGQYEAASVELDEWLGKFDPNESPAASQRTHPWYKVRARIYLGIIVEEWLRASSSSPAGLLEYHIENLRQTAALMKYLLSAKIETLADLREDLELEDFAKGLPAAGVECKGLNEDAIQLLLAWLNLYPPYMARATQSRSFESYSADVMTARRLILKKDVFCIANTHPEFQADVDQFYADFLQAYAEVEMANAARIALLPDQDAVRRSLDRAYHAAALGLQVIGAQADLDRAGAKTARSLKAQIEPKVSLDIEERLKSVQARAADRLKSL